MQLLKHLAAGTSGFIFLHILHITLSSAAATETLSTLQGSTYTTALATFLLLFETLATSHGPIMPQAPSVSSSSTTTPGAPADNKDWTHSA